MTSAGARYGLGDQHAGESGSEPVAEYHLTAEDLLGLSWRVAGATMAAMGIPRSDLRAYGEMVEPTIHEIIREYGVTIPEGYRR
jgi:hypothetical protein